MKAIVQTVFGGPEVLQPADRPQPQPRPNEILIKVAAAGVNRPDGTTSGVVFVPGSNPALFVAVGQTGVAYTKDFGATWIHADTTTTYGVGVAGAGVGFFAGARGHVSVLTQPLK